MFYLCRHLYVDSGHWVGLVDKTDGESVGLFTIVITDESVMNSSKMKDIYPKPQKCFDFQCLQASVGMEHT